MCEAALKVSDLKLVGDIFHLAKIKSRIFVFPRLKSALIAGLLLVFLNSFAFAYQITLEWDSNVEQDLAGYIVYYGIASRDYDYDVDVGEETSCTISNLYSGNTYYFAVTAYDIDGNESPYSAEIIYPESSSADTTSVSGGGGGGGGGGGCFISAVADGNISVWYFLGFSIFLLGLVSRPIFSYQKSDWCSNIFLQNEIR